MGRARTCEVVLEHESVSRSHVELVPRAGKWYVTDFSRHGTFVNAVKLPPQKPSELSDGDLLRIGPWTFRVRDGAGMSRSIVRAEDRSTGRAERLPAAERGSAVAAHQLQLLIDCSSRMHGAASESELARAVVDASIEGTGFLRAALLRADSVGEEIEILASASAAGTSEPFVPSRSLIREASSGEPARLAPDAPTRYGESIGALRIHSALCIPVMLGPSIDAYLYMDARRDESRVRTDGAGFSLAIARLCGLALANLRRVELERRQRRLEGELAAAREAQKMIVPPERGAVGRLAYSMIMRPGLVVAGDLFDVIDLGQSRVAVSIGDVTGEGVGAALLMACTQSHLHASLERFGDPAAALSAVNQYVCAHSSDERFVSMWVGVFDLDAGRLTCADAGHGYCLYKPAGGAPRRLWEGGDLIVGIEPDVTYQTSTHPLSQGDRLVLFSDGLIEQRGPEREPFGIDRVSKVFGASASCAQDVEDLVNAVLGFAGTTSLTDDTTVASVQIG